MPDDPRQTHSAATQHNSTQHNLTTEKERWSRQRTPYRRAGPFVHRTRTHHKCCKTSSRTTRWQRPTHKDGRSKTSWKFLPCGLQEEKRPTTTRTLRRRTAPRSAPRTLPRDSEAAEACTATAKQGMAREDTQTDTQTWGVHRRQQRSNTKRKGTTQRVVYAVSPFVVCTWVDEV